MYKIAQPSMIYRQIICGLHYSMFCLQNARMRSSYGLRYVANNIAWVPSMYINIMRTLRYVQLIKQKNSIQLKIKHVEVKLNKK